MNSVSEDRWNLAQKHEMAIWKRTVQNSLSIMEELTETVELHRFIISKIPNFSSHKKKILEIGVGPLGVGWAGLFGNGGQNIGIEPLDILKPRTEIGELNDFIESLQPKINILHIKGEHIPFESETFDLVVCNDVLEHTQDYENVLKESYRVMKKDGLFLFSVNVFSFIGYLKWNSYIRKRYSNKQNVLCHPHSFRLSNIESSLIKHSFEIAYSNKDKFNFMSRVIGKAKKVRFICTKGLRKNKIPFLSRNYHTSTPLSVKLRTSC